MEDNSTNLKSENLCKVCGDKASGKHYGVASCDGCRGFFKRSIRRNLEYVCKENGVCVVDVTRRNQCQACRFKKCLKVSMKRDAVQHERAPRSSQPTLHHYPLSLGGRFRPLHNAPIFSATLPLGPSLLEPPSIPVASLSAQYLHQGFVYPTILGSFHKPGIAGFHTGMGSNPNYIQKHNIFNSTLSPRTGRKDDEVTSSEEIIQNKLVEEDNLSEESNTHLELPILKESCRSTSVRHMEVPCLNLFPAENVYETAAKLLFLSIKWARTIPSFLQLSYADQSILLEESWNELFILTAAQWSLPVDDAILISNAVAPSSRHCKLEQEARKLREVITRLNLLRVDHTEHACLKALVLFKAECHGLCEPTHVELLQDQTHVMLHEYCSQRQTLQKARFGKLLLTLPAVQSVSKRGLEELLFRQTVGDVSIDRLLGDVAKATHP